MHGRMCFICLALVLGQTLWACNLPAFNSEVREKKPTRTPIVQRMTLTKPGRAESPATLDVTDVAETVIAQITQASTPGTPTPTETNTATLTPTYEPAPCNWAGFISDVTYPDDSMVSAGQGFLKTWRMKNLGTCTWTSVYSLVFEQGDQMSAPDAVKLTNVAVPPGGLADISVNLKAPANPGVYQAFFKMRSDDGSIFGVGPQASGSFWVRIQSVSDVPTPVEAASVDLDIRSPSFSVNPSSPYMGSPVTVSFTVKNKGSAAAGHFKVGWWSGEGGANPQCSWDVPVLSPDQTIGPLSCNYTYSKFGTYNSQLVMDTGNELAETNESNNSEIVVVKSLIKLAPITLKIPNP